ncbi:hypothetical protein EYF80_054743 [Liparis tanakae]|uniref:Uncharacterized protein n=1 Tax=Liparis tanakae TaxID=230148 RepID=A0A4Z2F2E3_9TELE|nr:hypothetical protein EYF80_054743 [Liparis tanakae]
MSLSPRPRALVFLLAFCGARCRCEAMRLLFLLFGLLPLFSSGGPQEEDAGCVDSQVALLVPPPVRPRPSRKAPPPPLRPSTLTNAFNNQTAACGPAAEALSGVLGVRRPQDTEAAPCLAGSPPCAGVPPRKDTRPRDQHESVSFYVYTRVVFVLPVYVTDPDSTGPTGLRRLPDEGRSSHRDEWQGSGCSRSPSPNAPLNCPRPRRDVRPRDRRRCHDTANRWPTTEAVKPVMQRVPPQRLSLRQKNGSLAL